MAWFFAGCTLVLLLFALRDELRPGGSLDWRGGLIGDDPTEGIIDLPRAEGWTDDDVLRTYAEIQSL